MKKQSTDSPKNHASLVHLVVRNHKHGDRERIYILGCSTNLDDIVHLFQVAVNKLDEDPIAVLETRQLWQRIYKRGEAKIKIHILSVPQNDLVVYSLNTY